MHARHVDDNGMMQCGWHMACMHACHADWSSLQKQTDEGKKRKKEKEERERKEEKEGVLHSEQTRTMKN